MSVARCILKDLRLDYQFRLLQLMKNNTLSALAQGKFETEVGGGYEGCLELGLYTQWICPEPGYATETAQDEDYYVIGLTEDSLYTRLGVVGREVRYSDLSIVVGLYDPDYKELLWANVLAYLTRSDKQMQSYGMMSL